MSSDFSGLLISPGRPWRVGEALVIGTDGKLRHFVAGQDERGFVPPPGSRVDGDVLLMPAGPVAPLALHVGSLPCR